METTRSDPTVSSEAEVQTKLEDGAALCLSGGGYRAMLFHVGALWRLNEIGWLPKLKRVSSVSGGSITAGVLALAWKDLAFDATGVSPLFKTRVADPLHALASRGIDIASVITGLILPGVRISDRVEAAYQKHLFQDATLQDLLSDGPGVPRFVFNATSVQTGALWRFSKAYMADYHLGMVMAPRISIAKVVAASSAFPPILSPVVLGLSGLKWEPNTGNPAYASLRNEAVLSDGGVYDNLGLETAWKRYKTILVSDGGARMALDRSPHRDWLRHILRILTEIDNQVRSLRKRITIDAFKTGARTGTYFGIGTNISDYPISDALTVPHERSLELARIPTRLAPMQRALQERLVNWGYAVCDAAMRSHVVRTARPPMHVPYPDNTIAEPQSAQALREHA
jgi:NTE family protein